MIGRCLRLLVLLFAPALAALAQPADLPGDEIKPVKLLYQERNNAPGRWAEAMFEAGAQPVRYYVQGTDVSAPLSVQVIAKTTDNPLQVTLHRQSWGRAEETGSTGSKGAFVFEGRAFGDVGVQLVSSSGEPVQGKLIFWQGAPAPPSFARVFTPLSGVATSAQRAGTGSTGSLDNAGGAKGGATSPVMYVIAGLLAAIVILLAFMLLRRGGGKTAAALLVAGAALWVHAPGPAQAQIVPIPSDPPKNPPNPFDVDSDPVPNPFDVDGDTPEVPRDKDKDATAGNDKDKDATAGNDKDKDVADDGKKEPDWEPSNEPKPDENDSADEADYEQRLQEAYERIDELNNQASSNRAEIENLRMLIESDKDNEPDPSNMQPLPLSCAPPVATEGTDDAAAKDAWEHYDACQSCYKQPLKDLEATLLLYEKLRIIYNSTRNYVNTAIAMGDAIEKPHYLLEATWAQQKAGILKTFDGTKQAYDQKWAEFNDRLSGNLDAVGYCETKFNNNPMWRETDGKIFYQNIKATYQRAD